MTTGGGLLFTGTSDGYVKAFDAKNGKELWEFQTGSGVVSVPITWEMDGEQYVSMQSGYGGAVPLWGADLTGARLNKVNAPAASFKQERLIGADLEFARVMRADFSGADLTAANLEAARANFAWFVGARLRNANLQETKFVTVNLKDADLEGAFLRYTIFPDAFMERCTGCPTE